jgi:UDP-2,3-diacylglucosamine hydrolase
MKQGLVISDLHLFAKRSQGLQLTDTIGHALGDVDTLVLNGDVVDFRWTTLATVDDTAKRAADWLMALRRRAPQCRIHVLLGNHDHHRLWIARLDAMQAEDSDLCWHAYHLKLDRTLFLHGDCANRRMDATELAQRRQRVLNERRLSPVLGTLYNSVHRLGITTLIHKVYFKRPQVADRILHYAADASASLLDGVEDIYFGHTHRPFENFVHAGRRFHNTGSALSTANFRMLRFTHR